MPAEWEEVYRFTPDKIDEERAHHQAVIQDVEDLAVKRIGNLGELAFEQFCREYLPVEMWEWQNEAALRYCNPESYAGYDFEVFGYEVDVKTSRDVSAFLPESLLETDPDDDIVVMVWHRDDEDSLMLLGWERLETLHSKRATQAEYAGEVPSKLDHLAARPMNELLDLGPNTAHMNQQPENPFSPGDRVLKPTAEDASVAVVIEVLPPEKDGHVYGQQFDGEAVEVAFPTTLDEGPGDWRDIHPALLASYCKDQDISLYTYKHTNLEFADPPLVPGDRVIHTGHEDPDLAVVVETPSEPDRPIEIVFASQLDDEGVIGAELKSYCEDRDLKRYSYDPSELAFAEAAAS